jgi:hypothetical protein
MPNLVCGSGKNLSTPTLRGKLEALLPRVPKLDKSQFSNGIGNPRFWEIPSISLLWAAMSIAFCGVLCDLAISIHLKARPTRRIAWAHVPHGSARKWAWPDPARKEIAALRRAR